MSTGHKGKRELTTAELDDLLAEALANPKVRADLAAPFKVITTQDIPLLGSSSINRKKVYFDRHLRHGQLPYGVLLVGGRRLDVKPGLTRHERLEAVLEDRLGWPYGTIAHPVAQHFEEQLYRAKGFDPRDVEKAFAPFIRTDEREPLQKVPTDLDLRPMLHDARLLARTKTAQESQKVEQSAVGYVERSAKSQHCGKCSMFVGSIYGGPACTLVKSPINEAGWCRRFSVGSLSGT